MSQLTKNFHLSEFACNDGNEVPRHLRTNVQVLAEQLQVLRDMLGKPVIINSGYRTLYWNDRVGGVPRSFHLQARAADIRIDGMTPAQVKAKILFLIKEGLMLPGGVKAYKSFVHYDTRGTLVLF